MEPVSAPWFLSVSCFHLLGQESRAAQSRVSWRCLLRDVSKSERRYAQRNVLGARYSKSWIHIFIQFAHKFRSKRGAFSNLALFSGSYYFKLFWTKGLRSNGTYYDKEPINLKSMNGSNEIEFDDLWSRLYNNIFEEHMTNNKYALIGYTGEDAFIWTIRSVGKDVNSFSRDRRVILLESTFVKKVPDAFLALMASFYLWIKATCIVLYCIAPDAVPLETGICLPLSVLHQGTCPLMENTKRLQVKT